MVRWKVFIGSTQKGPGYDNRKAAIAVGEAIARSNKQVYVYQFVNDRLVKQEAKWINGTRVI